MYKIINMNEQIDPSTENNFEKEQVLPLLKAQAGMWFMQKLLPPEATLNIAEAIEIHGPIDPDIFKTAMRQTIVEAESLRLRLRESYAGPEQVIDPEYRGRFPYFDVTTEPDQLAAAQQWMHDELNRPVDLLTDPLCQFALFKLADDRFIWYHRYHHIIMDGFGAGLIARRVAELYNMLSENRVSATGPTFGPLSALFEEEQAYRDSQRFVRDREYWMQRFGDKPESANLAVKHSPGMGGVLRRTAYLPAETVAELRSFARATGVSLPQFLIASVAAYLYRMTGMEDLVLGMIVTARSNPRMRQVPGMAANALPLRLKISPEQTVTELLAQVAKEARTVLRHQSYRYDDLRRDLQFTMANGQHLYATVVNIEPFDYDLRFGGHPITPHNLSNAAAENLTVFVYDRGDGQGLRIDFDANSSVYSEEELAGHQERLANFIESMAFDADRPIDRIELLTPSERQRLLVDWNATDVDFTRRHCIHQLIEAQVRKTPHALAVTCGDLSMSYDTLNASANRLAHYLRLLGVKPEARVAICLERSFEMVVSLLAVLKAGGAYVPLDPSYPEDRLVFMLEDCDPDVLLTRHDLAAAFGEATSNVLVVDVYRPELWAKQPAHDPDPKEVGLGPRNLAYMIYTSGSTGKPKGAMNEHRGVVNRLLWHQKAYRLTEHEAVLQKTPFSFDVSVWEFYWPLMTGARLVMAKPEGHKDPAYLAELIVKEKIGALHFVPSMLQVFIEHPAAVTCTCLRQVMCSGEALPEALARRFHERLPNVQLHNLYGPTEAAVDVTAWTYREDFVAPSIPLGKPIANTKIYVLDSKSRPTPVGVSGEIFIGGIQVGRGYWRRPELTDERFVADPFGDEDARLYRTGDLGRWLPDGNLEYLGRNDFQVKLRGFRIELGEIEAQLAGHPEIREAVVVVRKSAAGDPALVAYYTAERELEVRSIRSHLGEHLPDYMVPSTFVKLDALPLSPNGKLDRKALPEVAAPVRERVVIAPRNRIEEKIARIWQTLFGRDDLSIDDNFFELGGHSLQAVQMVAKVEDELGRQIPLAALIKAPTIEQLASFIADASNHDLWDPLVKLHAGGKGLPLFCIPGIGGQSHYLYHLASVLGHAHPVYAFQPLGLDGRSKPHDSIEAMAAFYLDLLLRTQPEGPYFLIGHSFGGTIAFEMAKRLEASGREVGLVALLDSIVPNGCDATDAELNVQSVRALAYVYGRDIDIDAAAMEDLDEARQLEALKPHLVELGVVREDAGMDMVRGLMNITNAQMRMSYRPGTTQVRQMLFIQAEERYSEEERAALDHAVEQWKPLSKRPFQHAVVSGNHLSMLSRDNALQVADILHLQIVQAMSQLHSAKPHSLKVA